MRLASLLLQQIGKQAYKPSRSKKVKNYALVAFSGSCFAISCVLLIDIVYSYFNYQFTRRPQIETQKREFEQAMREKQEIERQAGLK